MNLSDTDLEIIILKCGGRSEGNLIRPGALTAEHLLDLLERLQEEKDRRTK